MKLHKKEGKHNRDEIMLKIIFAISGGMFSGLLASRNGLEYIGLSIILSFAIYLYILFASDVFKIKIKFELKKEMVAVALTISSIYICVSNMSSYVLQAINSLFDEVKFSTLKAVITLLIIPFLFILYSGLIDLCGAKMKEFYVGMGEKEKKFFWIHIAIMTLFLMFLYQKTSAFSYASFIDANGKIQMQYANAILNTDSSYHLQRTLDMSSVGDIRHPLWLIIHLPFTSVSLVLSTIFPFMELSYPLIQCIIINICLTICMILLSRLIGGKRSLLIIGCTYPFILYGLLFETSQITACICILIIYQVCNSEKVKGKSSTLVAIAAGYTLTTCVLAITLEKITDIKKFISTAFQCALKFLGLCVLCGQSYIILNVWSLISRMLSAYGNGNYSLSDRMVAFTHSLAAAFVAVPYRYYEEPREQFNYFSYYLTIWNKEAKIEWVGIVVLSFAILGMILNYKNKFAKICFFWLVYNFFIFVIVGYSMGDFTVHIMLYAWAIISLVLLACRKILEKMKFLNEKICAAILIILLLYKNITFLIEICEYAVEKFPLVF